MNPSPSPATVAVEPTVSAGSTVAAGPAAGPTAAARHYRRPGWLTRQVFNRAVARLTRLGVSVWGSRVLEVRGRKSGLARQVPVNLLDIDGTHYLVSPRGTGEWVRNVRAADGRLDLLLGRHREQWLATEVADADKVAVLRAYLRRWKAEVGVFFDGVSATSTDADIAAIAPRHPVFALERVGSAPA
ncbi:MAG TPA: nitroreductase/quinone reductase family protein [Acidimicrobiales bacterium]|nr:nitroreductase/quinone reductase family protein [Acidimicrobiales bacterium]